MAKKKTFRCAVCRAVTNIKQESYIEGKKVCPRCFFRLKQANADKRYGVVRRVNPSWLDCLGRKHFRKGEHFYNKHRKKVFCNFNELVGLDNQIKD